MNAPRELQGETGGPAGGPASLGSARHRRRQHRAPEPEPINSDITRDHWLGKQGCYDRATCLPVRSQGKQRGAQAEIDYHLCTNSQKYATDLYDCCFFHSLGALEAGSNRHPEGCSADKWPYDTRYYENRLNYASVERPLTEDGRT